MENTLCCARVRCPLCWHLLSLPESGVRRGEEHLPSSVEVSLSSSWARAALCHVGERRFSMIFNPPPKKKLSGFHPGADRGQEHVALAGSSQPTGGPSTWMGLFA